MPTPPSKPFPLQNIEPTLTAINRVQTRDQRLRKLQGEMGEAIAAISRCLDDRRPLAHSPMLREIVQVQIVIDSLFARPEIAGILLRMQGEEYDRLKQRIEAGDFG